MVSQRQRRRDRCSRLENVTLVTEVAPQDMLRPAGRRWGKAEMSERGHDLFRRRYGIGNVLFGKRSRGEARLKGRGCQIDAFLQHALEELLETFDIAGHHLV